ncbi:hypothetical protein [Aliikangiella maris]|uniref:Uncharacterized protein n=2 Tax=Aliikangiella maris TaxID=3162458 RepID=A0ABV3MKZ4_9GAMM
MQPGMGTITATKIQTSSYIQQKFYTTKALVNTLQSNVNSSTIPSDIVDSGWDLYACNSCQNALLEYVYNNPTNGQDWANIFNVLSDTLGLTNINIAIRLTVTLADGSTISLKFKLSRVNDSWVQGVYEVDFENSKDGEGNKLVIIINDSPSPSGGGADFAGGTGSDNYQSYIDALRRAGAPITVNGDVPEGARVTCYRASSGRTVCVLTGMGGF